MKRIIHVWPLALWVRAHGADIVKDEKTHEYTCPDCNGDGATECCECGHESVCDGCDGYGSIEIDDWDNLTDQHKEKALAKIYAQKVSEEQDQIREWYEAQGDEVTFEEIEPKPIIEYSYS